MAHIFNNTARGKVFLNCSFDHKRSIRRDLAAHWRSYVRNRPFPSQKISLIGTRKLPELKEAYGHYITLSFTARRKGGRGGANLFIVEKV